jgi:hypothetical protein
MSVTGRILINSFNWEVISLFYTYDRLRKGGYYRFIQNGEVSLVGCLVGIHPRYLREVIFLRSETTSGELGPWSIDASAMLTHFRIKGAIIYLASNCVPRESCESSMF